MTTEIITYDQFCSYFPVSRETYGKLESYVSMITKWQSSINLISSKTLPQVWLRHIIDSFQLVGLLAAGRKIVDIGSGAGLPGIVLAIAGKDVELVESDGKKIAFLREASRQLGLNTVIHHRRVEDVTLPHGATITARAFASLNDIFHLMRNALNSSHQMVLLKGQSFREEIAVAHEHYRFEVKEFPSVSDPSGVILLLSNINQRGVKV